MACRPRSLGHLLYSAHRGDQRRALLGLLRFLSGRRYEFGNPRVVADVSIATDHTAVARVPLSMSHPLFCVDEFAGGALETVALSWQRTYPER